MCGPCACLRAGAGLGKIVLSAWLVLSWSFEPFPCSPEGNGGGDRVGGVMLSRGRWGRRGGNYQLAERAPDNAGVGQVGVWLKEGRSKRRGRGKGGDICSLALTSAGEGLGTPAAPPCPEGDGARRGRRAPGMGRPRRPAARAAPPPGARRCPVPLNSTKKGYACS